MNVKSPIASVQAASTAIPTGRAQPLPRRRNRARDSIPAPTTRAPASTAPILHGGTSMGDTRLVRRANGITDSADPPRNRHATNGHVRPSTPHAHSTPTHTPIDKPGRRPERVSRSIPAITARSARSSSQSIRSSPTVPVRLDPYDPVHLPPRGPVRAPFHEGSCFPPGHLEGSRRRGRRLLVGGMWHL
jgi:hypothetical protein